MNIINKESIEDKIVTVDIFAKAIAKAFGKEVSKEIRDKAFYILNFFGYEDRIIDFVLEVRYYSGDKMSIKDRDIFYQLQDLGLLQTDVEEFALPLGHLKNWRTHYWILNKKRIFELADQAATASTPEQKPAPVEDPASVYEEFWRQTEKQKAAGSA